MRCAREGSDFVLVVFAYVLFGALYLIAYPGIDLVSLTLGLAVLLLFEGAFDIFVSFRLRTVERSS